MRHAAAVIGVMMALTVNSNLASATNRKEVKLYWDELPNAILHKKIAVNLPDGTRVEGQVRTVQTDSVGLTVQKTSDAGRHPKGPMVISKSSLSSFELYARRPHDSNNDIRSGQEAGATIGALGGLALGAAIARHDEGRFYTVFIGSMLTGMALGGLLAAQTDTEIVDVQIIPEPSASAPAVIPAGNIRSAQQSGSPSLPPLQNTAVVPKPNSPPGEGSVLVAPSPTGKILIRRGANSGAARPNPEPLFPEDWPVTPNRSRQTYQF